MRKQRFPILILILITAVLLCSCGSVGEKAVSEKQTDLQEQGADDEPGTDRVASWEVSREIVLPDAGACDASLEIPEGGRILEWKRVLSGGNIYRFVSVSVGTEENYSEMSYHMMKLAPPYEEWKIVDSITPAEWVEGDSCFPWAYSWSFVMQEGGEFYTVLQGEEDSYLCQWTEQTGFTVKKLEEAFFHFFGSDDANKVKAMYVDREQLLYLTDAAGGFMGRVEAVVHQESRSLGKMTVGTNSVLRVVNNPYYPTGRMLYQAGNTMDGGFFLQAEISQKPELASDEVVMEDGDIVLWSAETEGYLCKPGEVWKFSTEKQEINKIKELYWQEQGRSFDSLLGASVLADGSMKLLARAGDKYILQTIAEDMKKEEKTVLELAADPVSGVLKQAVDRFNHESSEYYVEIREPLGGMTSTDFKTRIQAEISAGEGPDLLTDALFVDYHVEPTAEKNLLLELTEYLGEEEERILQNVWEDGKAGEGLYAIPYAFQVNTLVSNKDMVGDRTGWTPEELMECVRESGVQQFCSGFDARTLFWHLCGGSGINTDVIDWEAGVCDFESGEAADLLEFAAEYGGATDYVMGNIRLLEGDTLTASAYLYSPRAFDTYLSILENNQVYIGYPSADGGSGHRLETERIGISRTTEHVDGAVVFLEYLISDDMQEYLAKCIGSGEANITVFPAGREAMEHVYEYLLNVPSEEDEDIIVYEYGTEVWLGGGEYKFDSLPFTEESVEQMRTVLETAKSRPAGTETIFDIMWEETEAYFEGGKEAEEVLSILQNRIQLYFDERK